MKNELHCLLVDKRRQLLKEEYWTDEQKLKLDAQIELLDNLINASLRMTTNITT